MFCIHCGKQIEEGDRFCEFCGGLQEIAPEVTAAQAVQPQVVVQPQAATQAVQPQVVVTPQAQAVQPQVVVTPQGQVVQPQATAQPQPQVVYVQQAAIPQPAAPQPAQNAAQPAKKKPPVALFVILGILLTIGLIIGIIILIIALTVAKIGKETKGKIDKIKNIDAQTILEDNGFNQFYEEDSTGRKEKDSQTSVIPESGTGQTGQTTDIEQGLEGGGDIGQYGIPGVSWDSVGRPELSDFDWRSGADSRYSDPNVEWLDASQYEGDWKGMIIYSADGSEEIVNFAITVTPEDVTLLADWYMVHIGGNELLPEEDIDDTVFKGYEYGSGIHVESNNNAVIEIDEFWQIGGKQYGKGVLKLQGSADSEVYLVRP